MTTAADYLGRNIDLLIWDNVPTGSEKLLLPQLFGDNEGGKIVAGIQSLVQRFLILLLTEKGSVTHFSNSGCTFLTEMRSGRLRTQLDVYQAFQFSAMDIKRQLLADEDDTFQDDEKIGSIVLLSAVLAGDRVILRIQLSSAAGSDWTFLVPLPSTPSNDFE